MAAFFCEQVNPEQIAFVVIAARYQGKWLIVRHRDRHTWELPGGHIEAGETPLEAARRELVEETGALDFSIRSLHFYSVHLQQPDVYGEVFSAEVTKLGPLPPLEIEEVRIVQELPEAMTYPEVTAALFKKIHLRLAYEGIAENAKA